MSSVLPLGLVSDCKYLGRNYVFLTFPCVVPYPLEVCNTPAVMFSIKETV